MNLLDLFVRLGVKDEASGQIGGISDKIKGGIGTAAKVAGAALAAAGAATVALGKQALDSYANYEQLEGGISKLFGTGGKTLEQYAQSVGMSVEEAAGKYDALNQAHDKVMQNAQNAYKTAGMSANQYMEQVSGFAAALTNSLGGDTVKAAEQADVAMRAISDNVNTFGSDMESVQMAFQGFAKQNYTMLDNLKLGYGGTKQEMERLIADANEYAAANGMAADLSIESFSDIVTAIDLVQQKQGIAGTTAREAATTIEGSVNMAKAAWTNWLTELGKDNADMQTRTTELVDSVATAASNIVPRVQEIFTALVAALPDALAQVGATLGPALAEMGTSLLETAAQLIEQLLGYIREVDWASVVNEALTTILGILTEFGPTLLEIIPVLLEALGEIFAGIVTFVTDNLPTIFTGITEQLPSMFQGLFDTIFGLLDTLFPAITTFLTEQLPQLIASVGEMLTQLYKTISDNLPTMLAKAVEFFKQFINALPKVLPELLATLGDVLSAVLNGILDNIPAILDGAIQMFQSFVEALPEILPKLIEGIVGLIGKVLEAIITHIPDILAGAVKLFMALVEALPQILEALLAALGQLLVSVFDLIAGGAGDLLKAAGEFFGGLLDGAGQKVEELIDWVTHIPDHILEALGDLGQLLLDAGGSIIQGLWDGMTGAVKGMFDWVGGIADNIAKLKGPLPYDRKVLIENGQALMQGLRRGLRDSFEGEVLPYVERMADQMGDAFGTPSLSASYAMAGAPAAPAAESMRPSVSVYLQYDAGADASKMAYDIADVLRMIG